MVDPATKLAMAAAEERWGDLAAEVIRLVTQDNLPEPELQTRVSVLLASVHHIGEQAGERRGIERGAKTVAETTQRVLGLLRRPNA